MSPDLKFIESLWDVLEETLQSAGLLTKTLMHLLMEININFHQEVQQFVVKIL